MSFKDRFEAAQGTPGRCDQLGFSSTGWCLETICCNSLTETALGIPASYVHPFKKQVMMAPTAW
jgi:hypothetical protein